MQRSGTDDVAALTTDVDPATFQRPLSVTEAELSAGAEVEVLPASGRHRERVGDRLPDAGGVPGQPVLGVLVDHQQPGRAAGDADVSRVPGEPCGQLMRIGAGVTGERDARMLAALGAGRRVVVAADAGAPVELGMVDREHECATAGQSERRREHVWQQVGSHLDHRPTSVR